jgi:hypothetical protein
MFSSGLLDELRSDVEMNEPRDSEHAISLARALALKLVRMTSPYHGSHEHAPAPHCASTLTLPAPPSPATTAEGPACSIRRLSSAKMPERRRQGPCFNCNEKFVHGHCCVHLFYIDYDDTDLDDPDDFLGDANPLGRTTR